MRQICSWCFVICADRQAAFFSSHQSLEERKVVQKKKSSGHVSNHCWNEKISNLYSAHSRHEAGIWGKASGWRWFRDFDVKSVGMWAHGCTKVVFLAGIIYILERFHSLNCFCLYHNTPKVQFSDFRFKVQFQNTNLKSSVGSSFKI